MHKLVSLLAGSHTNNAKASTTRACRLQQVTLQSSLEIEIAAEDWKEQLHTLFFCLRHALHPLLRGTPVMLQLGAVIFSSGKLSSDPWTEDHTTRTKGTYRLDNISLVIYCPFTFISAFQQPGTNIHDVR
jgi:hypothetical protein